MCAEQCTKEPVRKKFPGSTKISMLKRIATRVFGVDASEITFAPECRSEIPHDVYGHDGDGTIMAMIVLMAMMAMMAMLAMMAMKTMGQSWPCWQWC